MAIKWVRVCVFLAIKLIAAVLVGVIYREHANRGVAAAAVCWLQQ